MNSLKPIIKGNLISEEEALAELEKLPDAVTPRGRNPQPPSPAPVQPITINLQNGFYKIDKPRILTATTQEYRRFLKDSGYGDLDSCSSIGFAKGMLKYNQDLRSAITRASLNLTGNDGEYVVNINQPNARKLVKALDGKLPTVGLMYRLFIPYIKELAQNNNPEAIATLKEMTDTSTGKAEWLEDLVLNKNKVKIGSKEQRVSLVKDKDGRFDRSDINEFGYPTSVKAQGEFYYWCPRDNERGSIRDRDSELSLNLDRIPSLEDDRLGVRVAKFFP